MQQELLEEIIRQRAFFLEVHALGKPIPYYIALFHIIYNKIFYLFKIYNYFCIGMVLNTGSGALWNIGCWINERFGLNFESASPLRTNDIWIKRDNGSFPIQDPCPRIECPMQVHSQPELTCIANCSDNTNRKGCHDYVIAARICKLHLTPAFVS